MLISALNPLNILFIIYWMILCNLGYFHILMSQDDNFKSGKICFKNVNRVTYLVHNENTKFPCPLLILHHLDYTLLIWTTKQYICACEEPTNLFIITIIIALGERFIRFY